MFYIKLRIKLYIRPFKFLKVLRDFWNIRAFHPISFVGWKKTA